MAKPGDPHSSDLRPATPFGSSPARASSPAGQASNSLDIPDHTDDDRVGFTSAASLAGVAKEPAGATRTSMTTPSVAEALDDEPEQASLFDVPERQTSRVPAARPSPEPAHTQAQASASEEIFKGEDLQIASAAPGSRVRRTSAASASVFGRATSQKSSPVESAEGGLGLFTVYALILFAIPTAGLAAVIALIAAVMRPVPDQELARSHYEFQKRTLMIGAIIALLGGLMIVVNLGVFVLVAVALWLIVRGTWGLMSLVHGKTIAKPHQWWIAARSTRKA